MRHLLVLSVIGIGGLASLARADVTFTEGDFSPTGWTMTAFTFGSAGLASPSTLTSGGNPGNWRRVLLIADVDETGLPSKILTVTRQNFGNEYDPSTGAITSIDYAEDSLRSADSTTATVRTGLFILQDRFYVHTGLVVDGPTGVWTHRSQAGLQPNDFQDVNGTSIKPRFGTNGLPMTFGFCRTLESPGGKLIGITGIDNWQVTVHTAPVPEPASLLSFAAIGLGFLRRRSAAHSRRTS